jgi:hypothetical protein
MLNLALIPLVPKAVSVLHAGKKDNLIYNAARCFGEQRHGDVGPIMPLDRMPFIAVKAPWPFLTVFCINAVTQLIQIKFEKWWFLCTYQC